jgi:pseudouridine kinase
MISAKTLHILVIGGMNMDILGRSYSDFRANDSLIGQVEMLPGGVGRNIAAGLRRLGAEVEFLTVLGNDASALLLRESCAGLGIGLSLSLIADAPSPLYLAIHDQTGEMRAAINDMHVLELLNAGYIRQSLASHATFDACVLDANLGEGCLLAAAKSVKAHLVADTVSAAKCSRLLPLLPYLTAIKPNLLEAQALSGETEPGMAAARLLLMGVKQVYISMGAEGLYFADAGESGLLPVKHIPEARVTGAGDAMAAGITFGVAKGLSVRETAMLGQFTAENFLLKKPGQEPEKLGK